MQRILKGDVSEWIWIAGSIAIGLIVMIFAASAAGSAWKEQQERGMISEFNRLADRVQSVCGSGFGNYATVEVRLAEIVRAIYPARGETEPPPDKNMTYIGTPGLKQDIFSILARLRGEVSVYDYELALEKRSNGAVDARGRQFARNLSLPSGKGLADILFAKLAVLGSSQIARKD
ncbi:MAG: hypothetical protein HYX24_01330 [Candidatus Aenigmarchaeota archaeon]|nr:hypothetical protein [Candidatus Aenigmarchaeota archaeon]